MMNHCSGGPLMTRINSGPWILVGLTSYGRGCGRRDELAVYTRITTYLTWIDQSMQIVPEASFKSRHEQNFVFVSSKNHSSVVHDRWIPIVCSFLWVVVSKID